MRRGINSKRQDHVYFFNTVERNLTAKLRNYDIQILTEKIPFHQIFRT